MTSSVVSPMLSNTPICLAMLKRDAIRDGAAVRIEAQGSTLEASVRESLVFVGASTES
ncbi:MAG: hypothetical protein ACYTF7_11735 [Planctomycetota bacterium]